MLKNKRFFFSLAVALIVTFAINVVIYLPTPFDTVIAYHKTEPVIASTIISSEIIEEVTPATYEVEGETEEVIEDQEVESNEEEEVLIVEPKIENNTTVPTVPFYSQFNDISAASWKKVGCGIASLAMLIEYYNPDSVNVDNLLQEGIDARAYLDSAGWVYAGLIGISKKYGLSGKAYDYGNLGIEEAYSELVAELEEGPVMASVHYTFQKSNPIPHLVIINGIKDGIVYYNDPAEKAGGGEISATQFKSAWKKRYIEFRLL